MAMQPRLRLATEDETHRFNDAPVREPASRPGRRERGSRVRPGAAGSGSMDGCCHVLQGSSLRESAVRTTLAA